MATQFAIEQRVKAEALPGVIERAILYDLAVETSRELVGESGLLTSSGRRLASVFFPLA
jgi:hypothetical protein